MKKVLWRWLILVMTLVFLIVVVVGSLLLLTSIFGQVIGVFVFFTVLLLVLTFLVALDEEGY